MPKQERYHVYLAVPGVQVCWGTVIGVVNSTAKHFAHPFNGGVGFSGVEDFNVLWTDAHNCYDRGEITHFAMLHGDISPDPTQRWLDILLDEMEEHGAAMVSAVSPIKDVRGLTSTGICDLGDRWSPFRRFTVRDVLERLPPTFDNRAAGYPDKPLLHNTGLWVCDLRNPAFHATNEAGELDLIFRFPDRSIRGPDGAWIHQRESEDWLFSRELWLRGVKNTFITSKVRLTHHGKTDFINHKPWGQFADGDDNTADKWRADEADKPFALLQLLQFELGAKCNLSESHKKCPAACDRFSTLQHDEELSDELIVNCAVEAYETLGFTGLIGWAYYNEPLLQADRMFRLMGQIKARTSQARFILWTNGHLIPESPHGYGSFEQIVISGYDAKSSEGRARLQSVGVEPTWIERPSLDDRLIQLEPSDKAMPCMRPFVEFIVDAYGNTHLCCYDWAGLGTLGNVHSTPFAEIAKKWQDQLPGIAGEKMNGQAPEVCTRCGHRWDKYQQHDERIVNRARRWRAKHLKQEATT